MAIDTKRQNFNVTPEQEADLSALREALDAPSVKDAILRATRIVSALSRETRRGGTLFVEDSDGRRVRVLIPELEGPASSGWTYLVSRPHPWRRQLFIKGRRLLASTVWGDMRANGMTVGEAAENWTLPPAAIEEAVHYCEAHRDLIALEADEEKRRLQEAGGAV